MSAVPGGGTSGRGSLASIVTGVPSATSGGVSGLGLAHSSAPSQLPGTGSPWQAGTSGFLLAAGSGSALPVPDLALPDHASGSGSQQDVQEGNTIFPLSGSESEAEIEEEVGSARQGSSQSLNDTLRVVLQDALAKAAVFFPSTVVEVQKYRSEGFHTLVASTFVRVCLWHPSPFVMQGVRR